VVYDRWADFRAWAEQADFGGGVSFGPAHLGAPAPAPVNYRPFLGAAPRLRSLRAKQSGVVMRVHEPVAPVTTQDRAEGISGSSRNEPIAIFPLIIPMVISA
jgi:hypothetical protein